MAMTAASRLTDSPSAAPVFRTNLPLPGRREGKVRDIYVIGLSALGRRPPESAREPTAEGRQSSVLIVATDRISAFDVIMPTPIPGKGRILTDMAVRWFDFVRPLGIIGDHLVSTNPVDVVGLSTEERAMVDGRMMLCRPAKVIPVECVVRGYLAGSGWDEYQQSQSVCGVKLPVGLRRCDRLPSPIFTPATKAEEGHDLNISFDQACDIAGRSVMEQLRDASLAIYEAGTAHALSCGIILADTKFEFGYALDERGEATDELMLIDEILTPDSSRFWPAERYEPGREQESFDKQYVRNYLLELVAAGRWDKTPPGPELPAEIVRNTLSRYEEARTRLFG
jgi:phosphoribosylaminoimidazole-succinocarboxamide synthase